MDSVQAMFWNFCQMIIVLDSCQGIFGFCQMATLFEFLSGAALGIFSGQMIIFLESCQGIFGSCQMATLFKCVSGAALEIFFR